MGTGSRNDNALVEIENQQFGNVESQSHIFTGSNFDAIVGLAYPRLALKNIKPLFDEMKDQHLLKHNMFAFSFAEGNSDLTMGYYDKNKFIGDVHWNDVKFKYMFGI